MNELLKLHIGGFEAKCGWRILNSEPGANIDYVGDMHDLSQFPDGCCEEIYAVHILQRLKQFEMVSVLRELRRLLIPGGKFMISVPDLETLCWLFGSPNLDKEARKHVMRMIFAGQTDDFDYNYIGLNFELLTDYLSAAGFGFAQRVEGFGLFNDVSNYKPYGAAISLNIIATNVGGNKSETKESQNNATAVNLAQTDSTGCQVNVEISADQLEDINQKTLQALAFQEQDQLLEASNLFKEILVVNSKHFPSLYSLSVIASKKEDYLEALSLIETAIQIMPSYAPAFFVKAVVLQALKRYDEALASYEQALIVNPDYFDAMNNRGNLLHEMKQYDQALASFGEILKRNPNADKALSNSGIILTLKNQYELSIDFFKRLLKANPDFDYARGLLFYSQLHCCDWQDFYENHDLITEGIQANQRACKSLAFMAFSNSASDSFKCAQIFAKQFFPAKPKAFWNGERYQHDKIRVAYVSPDFRQHPVGHLMAGVIEKHDKSRFETIAISIGIDDGSSLRARFIGAFSQFYDVQSKTTLEIAQLIRDLEVDILVDLAGYTADSRTDIFAYRPAPVQVNYLGYPGTMGVDYMDYILADRQVIPESQQQFYSEKIAYLPDTYLPTDGSLKIAERTPTREEMGLPATGVIFCSFNHDYKITPPIFAVWMRILEQVPGSVLWLMKLNDAAQRNLRTEAQNRGVDPERLIFATRVPLVEDHLARYRLADLFLDTSPYNAHTTASDALLAGLPVLTYMGQTFSGRVAGSLLNAIGLPELITHTLEDYEALAVKLALDSHSLAELKAKLAANQKTHPLFNTELFSKNLEQAFIKMWNAAQQNEKMTV